ncbi:MAG: adenosylmethionine decarboxylase [Candidatus Nanoarchaeia archaeon]
MGAHILVNFYDADPNQLNDIQSLKQILTKAALKAEMKILNETFHKFSPQGVTGILLLAESHISIHTWPEKKSAAADIFCCAGIERAEKAADELIALIKAERTQKRIVHR